MEQFRNAQGKIVYKDVLPSDIFSENLFHKVENSYNDDIQIAFHSNLGSITILDRMTGFGYRDVETGYRDTEGNFWLASGGFNILEEDKETIGEAIEWIKKHANTCNPDRDKGE